MNMINEIPGGQDTSHIDQDKQLHDNQPVKTDEDVHEEEAGNTHEQEAEKDMLDGPANDLIGQPDAADNHDE